MRVGLISCGAEKLPHAAPAAELYVGQYFRLCRTWISSPGRCDEWGILSAKHGLVMPSQVIDPYDLSLAELGEEERRTWAKGVHEQLLTRWGEGAIYLILAGEHYRAAVSRMPMVEDVIDHWTRMRKARGMRKPRMGIGVIKKYLIENRAFGA